MWKKQDDARVPPLEFGSGKMPESPLEPVSKGLIEVYGDSQAEKGESTLGPQRVLGEARHQPSMPTNTTAYPASMAAYTEAVNEFSKNAIAFIEQLPLLSKARDAYDRAMNVSAEVRKVLDIGEGELRVNMTQLAQVLNDYLIKPAPEKKKPELAKLEATRGSDEGTSALKRASPDWH